MLLSSIKNIIFSSEKVEISPEDYDVVDKSHFFLLDFTKDKLVYGINTGFGPMAQYKIEKKELVELQYNLIKSHACGMGNPLSLENVRAAILCRLYTFLAGKSGVHRDTVRILLDFLNNDILPFIPEHGSVGASGDLVQLSHIALALTGQGQVFFKGELMEASKAMEICKVKPLKIYAREALALINGTAVMTGISLVNLIYARKLLKWATLSSVLINEVVSSYDDFLSEELNTAKLHKGQIEIAKAMRDIANTSKLLKKRNVVAYETLEGNKNIFKDKFQSYYSLRCVPQVLGPISELIDNTEKILLEEFHSADDNPIVDYVSENIYHGGNFHGDYVSLEMDKLKIAITKLTMLCERQINYISNPKVNEMLPPFVNLGKIGLNYGMQAAQFTAVSTTAESQMLSNSMYVHSIPCNNDNQDIVSMGTNSALFAQRVIDNGFIVMSVLMLNLVQAVDYMGIKDKLSEETAKIYYQIRKIIPAFKEDMPLTSSLENIVDFLKKIKRI